MQEKENIIKRNEDLFCFKLQLQVGLITFKEIQEWADQKILEDNSDEIILDICFLKQEDEFKEYIDNFFKYDVNIDKEKIALKLLKQYFETKIPRICDDQLRFHVLNLELLGEFQDKDVFFGGTVSAHDDYISDVKEGKMLISTEEAYANFYKYLQGWILQYVDQHE